ncbi:hypothetical protein ambt_03325 [Alteromonas naphthalenivorans]|uniref:Uncharacterized protein n=1 Tax=Alteromonas naphthalenivorans TaxID=715451 RepID=F5ZBX9_ALTNA|nr:hypothetical protein ambt_03325 [Alteromonas naphthalenivorans]
MAEEIASASNDVHGKKLDDSRVEFLFDTFTVEPKAIVIFSFK